MYALCIFKGSHLIVYSILKGGERGSGGGEGSFEVNKRQEGRIGETPRGEFGGRQTSPSHHLRIALDTRALGLGQGYWFVYLSRY